MAVHFKSPVFWEATLRRCVTVPDVSKKHVAFIFKDQSSSEFYTYLPMSYYYIQLISHYIRREIW